MDFSETIRDADPASLARDAFRLLSEQRAVAGYGNETPRTEPATPTSDASAVAIDLPSDRPLDGVGGRFTVLGELGAGGEGQVLAVRDAVLGRQVAVKVARRYEAAGLDRFIAEARITASLEHPSILPVHDIGRDPSGRPWFAMRAARGRSLATLIAELQASNRPAQVAGIPERVEVMVRVCDAVAYAHAHGLVHRDLKPANILAGEFGEVIVLDWGTAARIGERATHAVGTPLYMPPEQARAEAADQRSDLYCIAATLWHLLFLKPAAETAVDAEEFWRRKREGKLADPPAGHAVPAALLAILRTALAAEPAGRWPDVPTLRRQLHGWLGHQEAIALGTRADAALAAARATPGHGAFAKVCEAYRHALALWPELPGAAEGLRAAQLEHAHHAVAVGDLELAGQLITELGDTPASLSTLLDQAQAQRLHEQRRGRWLAGAVVTAVIFAVLFAWWIISDLRDRQAAWRVAFAPDLEQNGVVPGIAVTRFNALQEEGRAVARQQGLDLEPGRTYWLDASGINDVRITVRGQWPTSVDGFEMFLGTPREQTAALWDTPGGFSCQFGGYAGIQTYIALNRTPGRPERQALTEVPFVTGRSYEFQVIVERDVVTMFVDGREVLQHRELLPFGGSRYRNLALRTWGDGFRLKSLRVERRAPARQSGPLIAGDALARAGQFTAAVEAWREVAESHPGGAVAAEALIKAYVAGVHAGLSESERRTIAERLRRDHPDDAALQQLDEGECQQAWLAGRHAEAVDLAEALLRRWPASRIIDVLLGQRPARLGSGEVQRLLGLLIPTRIPERLNLAHCDLTSLEVLRGLPCRRLLLAGNAIHDLSPLAGMPLKELNLAGNAIRDLSPLAGMPLQQLDVSLNPISTLEPLRGMPLLQLDASHTAISDLGALAGMPLTSLRLNATGVSDLRPLSDCTGLRSLMANSSLVQDLTPLARLPIRILHLSACRLTSLDAVARMPLSVLDVMANRIASLEPLRGKTLRELNLDANQVSDLSPLAGMQIESLRLTGNPISDLTPLAGCTGDTLTLGDAPIQDLTPLAQSGFKRLRLSDCPVDDLSPLARARFVHLELAGLRIASLDPLGDLPLTDLSLDRLMCRAPLDGFIVAQERRGPGAAMLRSLWAQAALISGSPERLRQMALPGERCNRLWTGVRTTYPRALEIAAACGARLLTLASIEDVRAVRQTATPDAAWLGLSCHEGRFTWADGRTEIPADISIDTWAPDQHSDGWRLNRLGWGDVIYKAHPSHVPAYSELGVVVLEWAH